MSQPILSIMIATLTDRAADLERLLKVLRPQCGGVELLLLEDQGQAPLGEKRQKLLEQAAGKYVCVVDDDDLVPQDYVAQITLALAKTPDATHCSLRGVMVMEGFPDTPFEHSAKYKVWDQQPDGLYIRAPNHLNTIRRDLALEAGYLSTAAWAEDYTFSMRLVELGTLTCEAWIEPVLYYYFYRVAKPLTAAMKEAGFTEPPAPEEAVL